MLINYPTLVAFSSSSSCLRGRIVSCLLWWWLWSANPRNFFRELFIDRLIPILSFFLSNSNCVLILFLLSLHTQFYSFQFHIVENNNKIIESTMATMNEGQISNNNLRSHFSFSSTASFAYANTYLTFFCFFFIPFFLPWLLLLPPAPFSPTFFNFQHPFSCCRKKHWFSHFICSSFSYQKYIYIFNFP